MYVPNLLILTHQNGPPDSIEACCGVNEPLLTKILIPPFYEAIQVHPIRVVLVGVGVLCVPHRRPHTVIDMKHYFRGRTSGRLVARSGEPR